MKLSIPAASDAIETLADWLEVEALKSANKQFSRESLVRVIRRTGSTDAVAEASRDRGSETSQRIAEDAFGEIENRVRACGPDRYPFAVESGLLRLRQDREISPYVLLLLLSTRKPTSGHGGTSALFEALCTEAALGYLGGTENGAEAIRFGSPRVAPLTRLSAAIDHMCVALGEGGGCKNPLSATHTGDDELDIVAWRKFPDLREGKLIAFGQCATGATDWQDKLAKLDGAKFAKKWFRKACVVDPVRLYFVPRRVTAGEWEHAGIEGGILFDRCRIVACLPEMSAKLTQRWKKNARSFLTEARAQ